MKCNSTRGPEKFPHHRWRNTCTIVTHQPSASTTRLSLEEVPSVTSATRETGTDELQPLDLEVRFRYMDITRCGNLSCPNFLSFLALKAEKERRKGTNMEVHCRPYKYGDEIDEVPLTFSSTDCQPFWNVAIFLSTSPQQMFSLIFSLAGGTTRNLLKFQRDAACRCPHQRNFSFQVYAHTHTKTKTIFTRRSQWPTKKLFVLEA